jgi:hypothetical protein
VKSALLWCTRLNVCATEHNICVWRSKVKGITSPCYGSINKTCATPATSASWNPVKLRKYLFRKSILRQRCLRVAQVLPIVSYGMCSTGHDGGLSADPRRRALRPHHGGKKSELKLLKSELKSVNSYPTLTMEVNQHSHHRSSKTSILTVEVNQHSHHGGKPALSPWRETSTLTMEVNQHSHHGGKPALSPWR